MITWGLDCPGTQVNLVAGAKPGAIWPYITGSDGIAWTAEQVRQFRAKNPNIKVYRVNQGFRQGPGQALNGDEFDLEQGAWTIDQIMEIIAARREAHWTTRVYCSWSDYGTVKQRLADAGMGKSVWFRIADWNIDQHVADLELHADVYAGQWASPTSNPRTLIPGTKLTLEQANADLSVVLIENTGTWEG